MMAEPRFNAEEKKVLVEFLESVIAELGSEISHTDLFEFRNRLREKKNILLGCLDKLKT
ncbi:MAG: hypothetical protein GXY54_04610 [Deltaproteobacteria bacterium]|nr:hypothetical protein [Deltaproteobacteria bacterium]